VGETVGVCVRVKLEGAVQFAGAERFNGGFVRTSLENTGKTRQLSEREETGGTGRNPGAPKELSESRDFLRRDLCLNFEWHLKTSMRGCMHSVYGHEGWISY